MPQPPDHRARGAVLAVAAGFLAATALAGALGYLHFSAQIRAYRAARPCPAADCYREVTATLAEKYEESGRSTSWHVSLDTAPPADRDVAVSRGLFESVQPGDTVRARIWRGTVTAVNGSATYAAPDDNDHRAVCGYGGLAAAGAALAAGALSARSFRLVRRGRARAGAEPGPDLD
ncbi:hypothetical protein [Kitasatospora viridis]|uniref:Uncharacterized protein n=1 Tax=Kitasatospora viridis TaxID=281105 RepID=A0A561SEG8_9ACTN|nr:hypothetical protein [Kitasatospora viridis]TWF73238.1 hypothetical protein FHX73_16389 [Kitasatospora viridis]